MENEMSNSYLTLYDVLFSAVYYCVIYVIYVLIAIACKCFLQINKFIHSFIGLNFVFNLVLFIFILFGLVLFFPSVYIIRSSYFDSLNSGVYPKLR